MSDIVINPQAQPNLFGRAFALTGAGTEEIFGASGKTVLLTNSAASAIANGTYRVELGLDGASTGVTTAPSTLSSLGTEYTFATSTNVRFELARGGDTVGGALAITSINTHSGTTPWAFAVQVFG